MGWRFVYVAGGGYQACFDERKKMNIPIIHEDETENEFEVELCCSTCAQQAYLWKLEQFNKVYKAATNSEPIKVPDNVNSEKQFIEFVKSL